MSKTKKKQTPRPKLAKTEPTTPDPDELRGRATKDIAAWYGAALGAISTIHGDMENLAAELKRDGTPLEGVYDPKRFIVALIAVENALNEMGDNPPYLADIPNPLSWRTEAMTATSAAG